MKFRAERIPSREITDEALFLRRRTLLRAASLGALTASFGGCFGGDDARARETGRAITAADGQTRALEDVRPAPPAFRTDEKPTSWDDATSYNNFYEFGTDKTDPAANAHTLRPHPWSVALEGEVEKPGVIALEDLLRPHALEERIYRLRCVEAWSMVIPWVGVPLGAVLARANPTSRARYVAFETLVDPEQMPGQRRRTLPWPYREGLRMDEAMHPLTLLAVGMYGRVLPNQNGAPLRLVVPWKYGFKSIKSIVRIRLQARQPRTTWSDQAPREYGFYANVNPDVHHPRWSQARERRIGVDWIKNRPTRFLNGYAEQVGALYKNLDLRRNY